MKAKQMPSLNKHTQALYGRLASGQKIRVAFDGLKKFQGREQACTDESKIDSWVSWLLQLIATDSFDVSLETPKATLRCPQMCPMCGCMAPVIRSDVPIVCQQGHCCLKLSHRMSRGLTCRRGAVLMTTAFTASPGCSLARGLFFVSLSEGSSASVMCILPLSPAPEAPGSTLDPAHKPCARPRKVLFPLHLAGSA